LELVSPQPVMDKRAIRRLPGRSSLYIMILTISKRFESKNDDKQIIVDYGNYSSYMW
jgi:hypothetical protein